MHRECPVPHAEPATAQQAHGSCRAPAAASLCGLPLVSFWRVVPGSGCPYATAAARYYTSALGPGKGRGRAGMGALVFVCFLVHHDRASLFYLYVCQYSSTAMHQVRCFNLHGTCSGTHSSCQDFWWRNPFVRNLFLKNLCIHRIISYLTLQQNYHLLILLTSDGTFQGYLKIDLRLGFSQQAPPLRPATLLLLGYNLVQNPSSLRPPLFPQQAPPLRHATHLLLGYERLMREPRAPT